MLLEVARQIKSVKIHLLHLIFQPWGK